MAVQPKQVLRLLRNHQDDYLLSQQRRRARVFISRSRRLVCRRGVNKSRRAVIDDPTRSGTLSFPSV